MRYSILAILFCLLTQCLREGIKIPYPASVPDSTSLVFLPGIVSGNGLDFNACFSPKGDAFYFSRSNGGQWDIYETINNGKKWSKPTLAAFSERYSEADPTFAPDGRLFFISNRPTQANPNKSDYDIWFIRPLESGGWSQPENLTEVNSDSSEYYISFSENGNLYFGSSRPGGFGAEDIYISHLTKGKYTTPQNLGQTINSAQSEHDPCISKDERYLIFKSENRPDGFGEADLYCSKISGGGGWMQAVNLGQKINTSTYEYCPYVSPDSRYFFFSSESDVKWISMEYLRKHIDKLCKE